MSKGKTVLIGTWIGALILIGYRSFHSGQGMPTPRSLIAANVVWTLLGVVSMASENVAGALSVGTLVGLLVTNSSILGAAATSVASASKNPAPNPAASAIGNVTGGVSAP